MTSAFDRSSCRRFATGATLILCSTLGAERGARADENDALTRTAARELALEGAAAFDQQDYSTALDRFRRAFKLFHAPSISIMEARTLARTGRFVEALDKYEETRRMPLAAGAPEAFKNAALDATREVEELRSRVPRLTIDVRSDAAGLDQARVWIDGKPLARVLWGVPLPIDPGSHAVASSAFGGPKFERKVVLGEGARELVTLDLGPSSPKASSPRSRPHWITGATVGWAAIGLGATALGTSAVTGVIALGKQSDLDSRCHPSCPANAQDDIDSFRLNRTASYVSFGIGAAAVATGSYLLLSNSHASTRVGAVLTPMGAHVVGAF